MPRQERTTIVAVRTDRPYVPGGVEFIETVVNKGRLPKSERTLSRRERREARKDAKQASSTLHRLDSAHPEGTLFTFKPLEPLS